MPDHKFSISCPIFQKQEPHIREVTERLDRAPEGGGRTKATLAEELQKQVVVLLSCPNYLRGRVECQQCRFLANFRNMAADLVIKANALA